MYILCDNQDKIHEYNLSSPFDVTTLSLVGSLSTSSNFNQGKDLAISADGTKMFIVQQQGGRIDCYTLLTAYDITTASAFQMVRNMNSTDGESYPTGICFSPDGTNMYVTGTQLNRVYHFSLSTGFDPSSTIAMVSETSVGSINARGITLKPDGSVFYIYSHQQNAVRYYTASTNFAFSGASYTNQYGTSGITEGQDVLFNGDGSKMFILDASSYFIDIHSVGNLFHPSGYHAAHTTTSVDSTTWTDINGMTATESAGTGTVNYAVSTDDRTTWKIAHNTSGVRNIVKMLVALGSIIVTPHMVPKLGKMAVPTMS